MAWFCLQIQGKNQSRRYFYVSCFGVSCDCSNICPFFVYSGEKILNDPGNSSSNHFVSGSFSSVKQAHNCPFSFLVRVGENGGIRYFRKIHGLSLGSQVQVFLFLFLFFRHRDTYNNNTGFRILLNSLLFNFALLCVLNSFSAIISRVCNAFFMAMIFLLPLFVESLKISTNRLIAEVLITFYLFLSFQKTFVIQEDGYSEMLPYRFELRQLIDRNAR